MTTGGFVEELVGDLPSGDSCGRAEVVRRLAEHRRRRELTPRVLQEVLDRFPVARWDAQTCGLYMRLVDEITPGGLPAARASMPEWFLVAANVPVDRGPHRQEGRAAPGGESPG